MSYKPPLPSRSCTALAGFSVLAVAGADAGNFLQAQTMNDVHALAPGQWHWNGWLSAKGRVIALFALLRVDATAYRLVLPDMPAAELAAELRRFVFRSKVTLDAACGLVAAAGPATDDARGNRSALADDGIALDLSAAGGVRTLWLLPADAAALAPADPVVDADWGAADLAHGLPRLEPAQREAWTPQMLSLDRLAAFSLRKGCYPGQEIVARTHYLGQARRGLVRLAGVGLREGMAVASAERAVGTVMSVNVSADTALAVIAADADGVLTSEGGELQRLPLLAGLERE